MTTIRLNKFLSESGVTSRRKADLLISQGRVLINQKVISQLGTKINVDIDQVVVDGKEISIQTQKITYALNKPTGIVSTTHDELGRFTVISLVPPEPKIHPIGRLDIASEGLLILTNDGALTSKLTHPQHQIPKTYQVLVNRKLSFNQLMKIRDGLQLKNTRLARTRIDLLKETDHGWWYQITLHQGKNRQIRRMMQALNCQVIRLIRNQIGQFQLKELQHSQYIILNSDQVHRLTQAT